MKVNHSQIGKGLADVGASKAKVSSAKGNQSQALEGLKSSGSEKVSLSEKAQAFQKAKSIASDSSINEAKVARLQKMIDEGSYNVNAAAVADRLVDEHLSMTD